MIGKLTRVLLAACMCVGLGGSGTLPSGAYASQKQKGEVSSMTPQQLAQQVRRKNWSILDTPGAVGPGSAAELLPLLQDHDQEVRELAVQCLHLAGGPTGKKAYLRHRTIRAR